MSETVGPAMIQAVVYPTPDNPDVFTINDPRDGTLVAVVTVQTGPGLSANIPAVNNAVHPGS